MDLSSNKRREAVKWASHSPGPLRSVAIDVPGGSSHAAFFTGRLTIISGLNGSGKTTFLRALASHLRSDGINWPVNKIHAEGLHISSSEVELRGELTSFYIDPVNSLLHRMEMFSKDPNFRDLLEGVDPWAFDEDLLMLARFVLARNYDAIYCREICELDGPGSVVPYFSCRVAGRDYEAFDAGRGELVALFILWALSRLPDNSLALLEEPESGLAQISQSRLIDALCVLMKSRDLQVITSSHYPDIIGRLRAENICIVQRLPEFLISSCEDIQTFQRVLGYQSRVTVLLLVEDEVAASVLRVLMDEIAPGLQYLTSIRVHKDGESGLLAVASKTRPARCEKDTMIVVADGDARTKEKFTNVGIKFLPGSGPPEELVRRVVDDLLAADFLNVDRSRIRMAYQQAMGLDHHDWINVLAEPFGSVESLMKSALPFLRQSGEVWEQAENLVGDISKLVDGLQAQTPRVAIR